MKNLFCPMSYASQSELKDYCMKEYCAWYLEKYNSCAIKALAVNVYEEMNQVANRLKDMGIFGTTRKKTQNSHEES